MNAAKPKAQAELQSSLVGSGTKIECSPSASLQIQTHNQMATCLLISRGGKKTKRLSPLLAFGRDWTKAQMPLHWRGPSVGVAKGVMRMPGVAGNGLPIHLNNQRPKVTSLCDAHAIACGR